MKKLKFKIDNEIFYVWYIKGPKSAPILHWFHANGLNAAIYENLLSELSNSFTVYAWDARAHGLNSNLRLPSRHNIFEQYTTDLVGLTNLLFEKHSSPIILAGHSFGATVCIKAEKALRGKLFHLVLADPVLFTPFAAKASQILRWLKLKKPKNLYLAQNAAKRRNEWPTKKDALVYLSQKKLFKNWDEKSIKNYVKYSVTDTIKNVQLRCPPRIESLIFEESEQEFLAKEITQISIDTQVYLAAKGSPTFAKKAFKKVKGTKIIETLTSASHLFPIEEYRRLSAKISENTKV